MEACTKVLHVAMDDDANSICLALSAVNFNNWVIIFEHFAIVKLMDLNDVE